MFRTEENYSMLKDKSLTYVTLFSSGGVGCHGFDMEAYNCVATNEIIPRRMDVQRANKKCKYESGYIVGDITSSDTKNRIFSEIQNWKSRGNDRIDVVIATPPCQGISVINHKKTGNEIKRNSLVVDSIEVVKQVSPRIFIFENVMAFQKTLCVTPDEEVLTIGDYIREALGQDYIISGRVMNFMNYGSNSSRTRSLIIGVDKAYRNYITPYDLFPEYRTEKTLRDVVYRFPRLEWGEICDDDFYHAFRTYAPEMRKWIHDLKEGESAFDNPAPLTRPHKVIDGKVVENSRKNRDKYTRQPWDRFIQCVHTRNDQLGAQNTVHPEQDRVYSIRELMEMMTVPTDFLWIDMRLSELNKLPDNRKRILYKSHEMNIRQCLGEAVPTEIMRQIAFKIKECFFCNRSDSTATNKLIAEYELTDKKKLVSFIESNPCCLDVASLIRITELCNAEREKNAAFYTNKFLVNEIMDRLPDYGNSEIRILEPSVGAGSFIPFLIKRYESAPHVTIDVVDIDEDSISTLRLILDKISIPDNFTINFVCCDFLTMELPYRFNLAIGNPPFSKATSKSSSLSQYQKNNVNKNTSNLSEMFLEKCIQCSDYVALVLNKTLLCTDEFSETRELLRTMKIDSITDFGRHGFTGVSIETMCMVVCPKQKPSITSIYSMKYNKKYTQSQKYITDKKFPYFIIYRDKQFDLVANKLDFNIFSVFRDRQITKSVTVSEPTNGALWVIKAKNIDNDGQGITHIDGYDVFISEEVAREFGSYRYVNNASVYLTPNMTYNPRVIENLPNTIADGSVAVLIPRLPIRLSDKQRAYFSTEEYRRFYIIARNLSTQSINVDKTSVFFYGVLKNEY